jgi:Fe2+ or Zn2+ uptake regulation protein
MTENDILASLRASGYRLTAPRRQLVDLLLHAEAPLTAEEIFQRARHAQLATNLSTVYRNLATFCQQGWLDEVPGVGGERHYQVHASPAPHMSVLCLDCGQLTSLQVEAALPLNAAVRDMGFDEHSLRINLAAHCGHECERKPSSGSQPPGAL